MRKFTFLAIVLLIALFAGQVIAQDEATPEATDEMMMEDQLRDENLLHDDSLLSGEPCAAPCWRGITPGETKWDEAIEIIQSDETLANVEIEENPDSDVVVATWTQDDTSTVCCQLYGETGGTADLIFLRIAPDITVAEVIEAQGEPAYAVASPFTETQAIVNLVYPDVPMVLYVFIEGEGGTLSEDSEVIGALYVTTHSMDNLTSSQPLHSWQGYRDYSDATEFDVTPEPAG